LVIDTTNLCPNPNALIHRRGSEIDYIQRMSSESVQVPCSQSFSELGSRAGSSKQFFYYGLFLKPTIII